MDPDGALLTYSITHVEIRDVNGHISSKLELPGWLTFDKLTRRFLGVPGIVDLGVYTINVQASDKF